MYLQAHSHPSCSIHKAHLPTQTKMVLVWVNLLISITSRCVSAGVGVFFARLPSSQQAWEETPMTRFGASRCVSRPCASAQRSQTTRFHRRSSPLHWGGVTPTGGRASTAENNGAIHHTQHRGQYGPEKSVVNSVCILLRKKFCFSKLLTLEVVF